MEKSETLFKRHFGYTPFCKTRAPGCVELLGSFAGLCEGLVLTIAIEKTVEISAAPRLDGKVEIVSSNFPDDVQIFWISDDFTASKSRWEDYIKSVLKQLQKRGVGIGGFNASINSSLPMNTGFGSSTALLCAAALTLRKLYPFRLTEYGTMLYPPKRDRYGKVEPPNKNEKFAIATLCKNSENAFLSLKDDMISELTCLFGKKYYAVNIDCKFNSYEYAPLYGEIAIIAFISGNQNGLDSGKIEELRRLSQETAFALGVKSLRSIDMQYLKAKYKILNQKQYNFAHHIVSETQRVVYGVKALNDGDFEQFGQYMIMSYESAREKIGCFPEEINFLISLCLNQRGCYGARAIASRNHFTVIAIISSNHYENFLKTVPEQFFEKTKIPIKSLICVSANGAE